MSASHSRGFRGGYLALAALVLGLSLAGTAGAQTRRDRNDGYLDRVRKLTEVQAQKMEEEITTALAEARKLGAKDPVQAVDRLKKALGKLEDDTALADTRRATLAKLLKGKIRYWQSEADRLVKGRADHEELKSRFTRDRTSRETTGRDRVERIDRNLRGTRDYISESQRIRREANASRVALDRDIERAAIPATRDVTFPKDWKKRIAKRQLVKLTKQEEAILRVLNSVMSVNFKDNKLEDVIDYIMDKTKMTILVDRKALEEAGVDYETPVTLKVNKIGVRTLLRKILNDLGLTYVIKDEAIQVTTLKRARELMTVRVYPVADLVVDLDPTHPPAVRQLVTAQNAAQLMALIRQTVETPAWASEENGGMGASISFNAATLSLVVKASAEMHYALKQTFGR